MQNRWAPAAALLACLAALLSFSGRATAFGQAARGTGVFRIAFSAGMLEGLNRADAKAAMDVWGSTIAVSKGIAASTATEFYETVADLGAAIRSGRVHLIGLRTDEYLALGGNFGEVFFGVHHDGLLDEYLVLVKRTEAPNGLAGLRGKQVVVLAGSRAGMATEWLDTVTLQSAQVPASEFFGSLQTVPKVSRAVLPVFFGQKDACVVPRSGFRTMVELNPQVGKDLVEIAVSPSMPPSFLVLSDSYQGRERAAVIDALQTLHEEPKGQQLLNMFGHERLFEAPKNGLDAARAILATRERLLKSRRVTR
jgi:ABC-type phosphate/phosphonate transport system substrate-binding protein